MENNSESIYSTDANKKNKTATIMKIKFNEWPTVIRFFAPQIYKYQLKTFVFPALFLLYLGFYCSRLWWKETEFDFFERGGVLAGVVLLILTIFQIGSYLWIKKNSSLDLIPPNQSKTNKLLMILFFVILPLIVCLFPLISYFK